MPDRDDFDRRGLFNGLDFTFPDPPSVPRETSERAAENAKRFAGTQRGEVFEVIEKRGGATAQEIGDALGLTMSSINPRLGELMDADLIRKSGRLRKTRAGNDAIVWVVNPNPQPETLTPAQAIERASRRRNLDRAVRDLRKGCGERAGVEILKLLYLRDWIAADDVAEFTGIVDTLR